jgi:hypothetical protein
MDSFDTCKWVDFVVKTTFWGTPTILILIKLKIILINLKIILINSGSIKQNCLIGMSKM